MLVSSRQTMLYNREGSAANLSVWNSYTRKYYYSQEIASGIDGREEYLL